MKKLLLLIICLCSVNIVFAQETCTSTKCMDLTDSMYNNRAALYNVLNLSKEQQIAKDEIDKKYRQLSEQMFDELSKEKYVMKNLEKYQSSGKTLKSQEKIIKSIEDDMRNLNLQYDNELKTILKKEQLNKLKSVRKIEKQALKHCQKDKALYKRDNNVRIFGQAY